MKPLLSTCRSLVVACVALAGLAAAAGRPPNVIFILADDLGYTDLACQGSKYYETPNIDRLAADGLRLTDFYNCQNCQPTRAALMTGQYGARTGVYTVGGIDRFNWRSRPLRPVDNVAELPAGLTTIAQSLKSAGYATAMFGKWHLGEGGAHHPSKRGFDEAITSAGRHFKFRTIPPVDYPEGTYLADFLTDKAEDFIRRHKEGAPFFLYLPHFGVHGPFEAKQEWIDRFKSKRGLGGHKDPVYAAMIASVDESVGRILRLLDELEIADRTVVVFASDNGGVGGYAREGIQGHDVTDNAPLRGGKGMLYEGGIRVPFIVRWPGVTRPGATCGVPAIHVDLFPTLLEISGAVAPKDQPLDGESLVKLFRDPASGLDRDAIYQHFPGYLGSGRDTWRTTPVTVMRQGEWKLMEFLEDRRLELYNLKDDIGEKNNLAAENPAKAKELHERMLAWRKVIHAPMPTPNDPKAAPKRGGKGKKAQGGSGKGG